MTETVALALLKRVGPCDLCTKHMDCLGNPLGPNVCRFVLDLVAVERFRKNTQEPTQ